MLSQDASAPEEASKSWLLVVLTTTWGCVQKVKGPKFHWEGPQRAEGSRNTVQIPHSDGFLTVAHELRLASKAPRNKEKEAGGQRRKGT
jgi:hypothetical protein